MMRAATGREGVPVGFACAFMSWGQSATTLGGPGRPVGDHVGEVGQEPADQDDTASRSGNGPPLSR